MSLSAKSPAAPVARRTAWIWLIPIFGILLGSLVSATLAVRLLQLPLAEVIATEVQLVLSSLMATALALLLYRVGWFYQRSLSSKLLFTTFLVGVITFFNGYRAADLMLIQGQQLVVVGIMLVFAIIAGTSFGVFGFSEISRNLHMLAGHVRRVAAGDLSVRAQVVGQDEVAQLSAAFNDMTEQLQAAERERRELEKLRRDLIAWVSHDLRTPLTSIRAMVEALNDGMVDDPATTKRYYRTIRSDIIALNRLIDDLFELAQLDAGGVDFEIMPASLGDLISDAIDMFRPVARQRGITIGGEIGDDLDPVPVDAQRIGRVLANLLANALKYTPDEGCVTVCAFRDGDRAVVEVQDSGPGFAASDLPRVFEKFYRGEGARSRHEGSGAGLGLSIARGIVEAHGGEIFADNAADGGAVVIFTLPL